MFNIEVRHGYISEYKVKDPKWLLEKYKESISKILAFIKQIKPRPELRVAGRYLLIYQKEFFNMLIDILDRNRIESKLLDHQDFLTLSYDNLMSRLGISKRFVPKEVEYYKDVWGPIYWEFLHLTSIMCKTEDQKDAFACIMMNFNLILMCSACAFNFKDKNPFMLTMIIMLTKDAITNMYSFHNIVNLALNKYYFDFGNFLELYKLEHTKPLKEQKITFVTLKST